MPGALWALNPQLTHGSNANPHRIGYTYDSMNRVASRTDPMGHAEGYQHDQNGGKKGVGYLFFFGNKRWREGKMVPDSAPG